MQNKEYADKNQEKIQEYSKKYYQDNKELRKAHYQDNKEKIRVYQKKYRTQQKHHIRKQNQPVNDIFEDCEIVKCQYDGDELVGMKLVLST